MKLNVCIPDWLVFSWKSQADQYTARNEPGFIYERHYGGPNDAPPEPPVDCLLYYDDDGTLAGILNHYPTTCELEEKGNANLWVDPAKHRRGIGTKLLGEAQRRWNINLEQQRYTPSGAALVRSLKGIS